MLHVPTLYILILRRLLLLHLLNLHLEHHLVVPIQISRIFFIVLNMPQILLSVIWFKKTAVKKGQCSF